MFSLQWEYLTGKAVAAQWDDRSRPEWPPHPDRVFQALVAAWGETGKAPELSDALRWLESQPAPALAVPEAFPCPDRPVYVPTNDIEASARTKKYSESMLALLPASRIKALRAFPAHTVAGTCALVWPEADPPANLRAALDVICACVTHIGHSSSVVRLWPGDAAPRLTLAPSATLCDMRLRVPFPGRLEALVAAYADGGPTWTRPPVARWQGYARVAADGLMPVQGIFGSDWLVYRLVASPRFGLAQTLAVTDAFRKTLIAAAERAGDPVAKALVSGHAADGTALATPHLAYVPLGFVDHEHADGHLLGVAVVLPRILDYATRDACLAALAECEHPESGEITLTFTSGDRLTLVREERESPPRALAPATWCAPSTRWASVTPVVLDRMPRRREGLQDGWAAAQLSEACVRAGLPAPAAVSILPASRCVGAPPCQACPPLLRRTDHAPRWHVHAELVFPQAVRGPVLLGAGRFRGYGLCRPLPANEEALV